MTIHKKLTIFILFIIFGVFATFIIQKYHKHHRTSEDEKDYIETFQLSGHGQLRIQKWRIPITEKAYSTGPFLKLADENFLISSRLGELYLAKIKNHELTTIKLYTLSLGAHKPQMENDKGEDISDSGIKDLKLSGSNLYLSATNYYPQKNCYTLKLFHANFANSTIKNMAQIWESQPSCIKGSPSVAGELGGKFAVLNNNEIIIGVGGGDVDKLVKDQSSDYGKVLLLQIKGNTIASTNIFTIGHRNPSGIYFSDKFNKVFETEHGPSGGDELNELIRGKNYGWPNVTYGHSSTLPDEFIAKKNEYTHVGYTTPLFSWVPSIGISGVSVMNQNKQFPKWKNDIFVGSLSGTNEAGQSLYRLHYEHGTINLLERIKLKDRVRSFTISNDGSIWFKTDSQYIGKITKVLD